MPNYPQAPNVNNVLVGPARILVAPIGTTLPTLDGSQDHPTWPAGWTEVGYTESGTDLAYNPSIKDIMVDEEKAAVKKILDTEKATITSKLAEATMKNLATAISAALYSTGTADGTHAATEQIDVGSGEVAPVMVGFEGINPNGGPRILIGYKAITQANVQLSFKRAAATIIPVDFGLTADSTQAKGKRLFKMVDIKTSIGGGPWS